MAGFFNRLLGSGEAASPSVVQPVSIGRGWPDIEVEGESYRRAEVARLFNALGRPEGGVTMQQAHLVPEPGNRFDRDAVKVVIGGEHVGYVPAGISAQVSSACKGLGRGSVAVVLARVWARVDDGTWRARVTLSFTGASEAEQDYAEQRGEMEALSAQRVAAAEAKSAERASRDAAKASRREAGMVRGEYWTTWKPSIAELKRQQRLEEARDFLIECRSAASRESAVSGGSPDSWPTEQLAAVTRRLGDRAGELAILEQYVAECGNRDIPDSVVAKVAKAQLASGSHSTNR